MHSEPCGLQLSRFDTPSCFGLMQIGAPLPLELLFQNEKKLAGFQPKNYPRKLMYLSRGLPVLLSNILHCGVLHAVFGVQFTWRAKGKTFVEPLQNKPLPSNHFSSLGLFILINCGCNPEYLGGGPTEHLLG